MVKTPVCFLFSLSLSLSFCGLLNGFFIQYHRSFSAEIDKNCVENHIFKYLCKYNRKFYFDLTLEFADQTFGFVLKRVLLGRL